MKRLAGLNECKNPSCGGFLSCWPSMHGFTQVELVVVIVIVGVLALAVVPRFSGDSGFEARAFRDGVVAGLRYAHKSAVAARRTTCAVFATPPAQVTFRISNDNGAANCVVGALLVGPDNRPLQVTAANNVTFVALPADVVFDAAGRPQGAAAIGISGLDASLLITVEAETGYVH